MAKADRGCAGFVLDVDVPGGPLGVVCPTGSAEKHKYRLLQYAVKSQSVL